MQFTLPVHFSDQGSCQIVKFLFFRIPAGRLAAKHLACPAVTDTVLQDAALFHCLIELRHHADRVRHLPIHRRDQRILPVRIIPLQKRLRVFKLQEKAVKAYLRGPVDKVENILNGVSSLDTYASVAQRRGKTRLRAVVGRGELDRYDLML